MIPEIIKNNMYIVYVAVVVIIITIFIKVSQIKHHGQPVLKLRTRILIALLFPIALVFIILFGSIILIILGVLIIVLLLLFLIFFIFTRRIR